MNPEQFAELSQEERYEFIVAQIGYTLERIYDTLIALLMAQDGYETAQTLVTMHQTGEFITDQLAND